MFLFCIVCDWRSVFVRVACVVGVVVLCVICVMWSWFVVSYLFVSCSVCSMCFVAFVVCVLLCVFVVIHLGFVVWHISLGILRMHLVIARIFSIYMIATSTSVTPGIRYGFTLSGAYCVACFVVSGRCFFVSVVACFICVYVGMLFVLHMCMCYLEVLL